MRLGHPSERGERVHPAGAATRHSVVAVEMVRRVFCIRVSAVCIPSAQVLARICVPSRTDSVNSPADTAQLCNRARLRTEYFVVPDTHG